MGFNLSRKTLRWTIAGVIVAVVIGGATITIALLPSDDGEANTQTQSGTGNQQAQGGGVNVGGDLNIQSEQFKEEVRGLSREEAERAAERYKDVPPNPGEPAPFVVIDAPTHLWVRSSGTVDGHHIGAAYDNAIVWADCVATTDFDPVLDDETGRVWLRIHWPTDQRNDNLASSQPSDRYRGWVYSGYALPSGHNGRIPNCDAN